jgi:hypothetical protein
LGDAGRAEATQQARGAKSGPQKQDTPPLTTPKSVQTGGQIETLAKCMSYWDRDTHMTKREWRAVCQRQIAAARRSARADASPRRNERRRSAYRPWFNL